MLSLTIDDAAVTAALRKLSRAVSSDSMDRLFNARGGIGDFLIEKIRLSFESMHSPWGEQWQGLSHAAIMGRLRKNKDNFLHGKNTKGKLSAKGRRALASPVEILRDTGRLFNSIERLRIDGGVEVRTNTPYAAVHQLGSPRKGIPARAFFPVRSGGVDLPESWREGILAQIRAHVEGGLT